MPVYNFGAKIISGQNIGDAFRNTVSDTVDYGSRAANALINSGGNPEEAAYDLYKG